MKLDHTCLLLLAFCLPLHAAKPNILFITVDDMSCDSVGVYGCKLKGTTPHMDQLAAEGLRFDYAHVQVGNCYPSRNVMFSGRYPHNTGVEGFYQVKPINYPVMCDLMKAGGYYTAIRGKVSHSTPYQPYAWDDDLTTGPDGKKLHVKDVPSYHDCTLQGIAKAKTAGKPFCLNINISDPHKPFWKPNDPHKTSKVFTAEEVPIPGFLFDDPLVRKELALYYTSVRRADDAVGAILRALEKSGERENTVVIFLSDHGMPLPFAKTQLYHHSTRTPWMVRWPGVTKPGSLEKNYMISAVDLLPTLLDIAGIKHPKGFDGQSFVPIMKGQKQLGRSAIFKVYNENAGGNRHPIRGVQTKKYLYLFNPWSDDRNVFKTATNGTATYRQMRKLAPHDPYLAARLDMMDFRELEELYDIERDPDCLKNLVELPNHAFTLKTMQAHMEEYMRDTNDHALEPFLNRNDRAALAAYIQKVQGDADARRANKRKRKRKPAPKAGAKGAGLLRLNPPSSASAGKPVTITIAHTIPANLKEQGIHAPKLNVGIPGNEFQLGGFQIHQFIAHDRGLRRQTTAPPLDPITLPRPRQQTKPSPRGSPVRFHGQQFRSRRGAKRAHSCP